MNIDRSETSLLVFISSVMRPELEPARNLAREAFLELEFTRPWAFEFTPASSEPPDESYLRKVQESDFVVWLIGDTTTQPVVATQGHSSPLGRRWQTHHREID